MDLMYSLGVAACIIFVMVVALIKMRQDDRRRSVNTIMQHYTTVEQSKRLLELGLSPKTADMYYPIQWNENNTAYFYDGTPIIGIMDVDDLPCWSLGALIEVMPVTLPLYPDATEESVRVGNHRKSDLIASMEGYLRRSYDGCYEYKYGGIHCVGDYAAPINAAYKMVCWLLENGYIEEEK